MGRVLANVQTQIAVTSSGKTSLVTHVSGLVRSSEGTSTAPITCGSSGALEQLLHREVSRRLVATP